ncbi:MAG: hypothetical protein R3D33_12845 [Hyphomicrobiaceae bacterium]
MSADISGAPMDAAAADERAIVELIERQFASMSWSPGSGPDVAAFKSDFLAAASLFPAARPVARRSLEEFCTRMSDLARTSLPSFDEQVIGTDMRIFGSVAVAVVVCESTENGLEKGRNVEMMLLVKDGGRWRIAAQAWDRETAENPIPPALASPA